MTSSGRGLRWPATTADLSGYADADQREVVSSTDSEQNDDKHYTYGQADQNGNPVVQSCTFSGVDNTGGQTVAGYQRLDAQGNPLGVYYNGKECYYATGGLGAIVVAIESNGLAQDYHEYQPYGDVGVDRGASDDMLGGQLYGFDSGLAVGDLVKFGIRWYAPGGRFVQQDSLNVIGNPGDGNRYAFAADDPVNNTDPTGQISGCAWARLGMACSVSAYWWQPSRQAVRLLQC